MTTASEGSIKRALERQIAWLDTWKTKDGGYNGFVIHRFEQKRMHNIHDTAWAQAAMIRGFLNLYKKSGEYRWYKALREAADLQCSRYDNKTGKYFFAGHENDKFTSLVHCALANCALLDAAPMLGPNETERYIAAVIGNVDRYWLQQLWVESEQAFRFSEIDYYSPSKDRFVVNFNMMAIECLIKLYRLTGFEKYERTALKIGEWLLRKTEYARTYYECLITKSEEIMPIPQGGLAYQYTNEQIIPDNCVSIYAGLALRGITELFTHTKDPAYAQILTDTICFLSRMRDPESSFFYHTTSIDKIIKMPQFISGAGMTLTGIKVASEALGLSTNFDSTVISLLHSQYSNGAFPSFIGKDASGKRNGHAVVWEDSVACVSWNAQLFEYLTSICDNPKDINTVKTVKANFVISSRFIYFDSRNCNFIFSIGPIKSMGLYFMVKRINRALALYPMDFYAFICRLWRSHKQ